MADSFRALHLLSGYPFLNALARQHTAATRLDGRAVAAIYRANLNSIDEPALQRDESRLMRALGIDLDIKVEGAFESRGS